MKDSHADTLQVLEEVRSRITENTPQILWAVQSKTGRTPTFYQAKEDADRIKSKAEKKTGPVPKVYPVLGWVFAEDEVYLVDRRTHRLGSKEQQDARRDEIIRKMTLAERAALGLKLRTEE